MAILCKQSKLQQNLGGPPLTSLHEAPDLVLCCEDGAEKKALLVEAMLGTLLWLRFLSLSLSLAVEVSCDKWGYAGVSWQSGY